MHKPALNAYADDAYPENTMAMPHHPVYMDMAMRHLRIPFKPMLMPVIFIMHMHMHMHMPMPMSHRLMHMFVGVSLRQVQPHPRRSAVVSVG